MLIIQDIVTKDTKHYPREQDAVHLVAKNAGSGSERKPDENCPT